MNGVFCVFFSWLHKLLFCSCGLFACSQPRPSAHKAPCDILLQCTCFKKKKNWHITNFVASCLAGQDGHSDEHHWNHLHHAVRQQLGAGHVSSGLLPCLGQRDRRVKGKDPWESTQGSCSSSLYHQGPERNEAPLGDSLAHGGRKRLQRLFGLLWCHSVIISSLRSQSCRIVFNLCILDVFLGSLIYLELPMEVLPNGERFLLGFNQVFFFFYSVTFRLGAKHLNKIYIYINGVYTVMLL